MDGRPFGTSALLDFRSDVGWLCLSKPTELHGRLGEGYSDVDGESYVWKADLPNGRRIEAGHVIAIWDGARLRGVSRIEGEIEEFVELRPEFSCPSCNQKDVRPRKKLEPRFRCADCYWTGNTPNRENQATRYRRAWFGAGWTEVGHLISADKCRALATQPKSQHSLREMDLAKLSEILKGEGNFDRLPVARRSPHLNGGHVLRTVKTRIGQDSFRKRLLERFGCACAFTGPNHEAALEAAHLYSYAELAVHHEDGGLLLRRDIHRLFDKGLITVDVSRQRIEVAERLGGVPAYGELNGRELAVRLPRRTLDWLVLHRNQARAF
jgi:hypothetical protein